MCNPTSIPTCPRGLNGLVAVLLTGLTGAESVAAVVVRQDVATAELRHEVQVVPATGKPWGPWGVPQSLVSLYMFISHGKSQENPMKMDR